MKAILLGSKEGEEIRARCVYIPEAGIVSVSDHRTMVYLASDYHDLKFFLASHNRTLCEFDLPFDTVAKLYCLVKDCRPSELTVADNDLWNELVKKEVRQLYEQQSKPK